MSGTAFAAQRLKSGNIIEKVDRRREHQGQLFLLPLHISGKEGLHLRVISKDRSIEVVV